MSNPVVWGPPSTLFLDGDMWAHSERESALEIGAGFYRDAGLFYHALATGDIKVDGLSYTSDLKVQEHMKDIKYTEDVEQFKAELVKVRDKLMNTVQFEGVKVTITDATPLESRISDLVDTKDVRKFVSRKESTESSFRFSLAVETYRDRTSLPQIRVQIPQ